MNYWVIEYNDDSPPESFGFEDECKDAVWQASLRGDAHLIRRVYEEELGYGENPKPKFKGTREAVQAWIEEHAPQSVPPVDRSNLCTIHGADPNEVRAKQREEGNSGQHSDYLVLCEDERAKGFVRPVRRSYKHLKCGAVTTMGLALAETYARDPHFYGSTFYCRCNAHFPVGPDGEFVWDGTDEKVGI